jgi:predicted adenylyl cyclase CyaB
MQEIEAKFYVMNLNGVRMRLQSLEARLIQERVLEINIRFDLPGGGLRSEGRVIRLRRDTEAKFTYKGPSTVEQGILNHIEIEFTVGDFEKAKAFIEAIGYQPFFYYEKYRTTYDVQTSEVSTHVMLDELPYGNFVEIEGESPDTIRSVANKLDLNWDTAIPTSYHLLFERLCAKHPSIDSTNLSFASLKGLNITAADLSVHAADG